MKRILLLAALLLLFILPVSAETADELYEEQLEASGGDKLLEQLPEETKELLEQLGIRELDMNSISALQPQGMLSKLLNWLVRYGGTPVKVCGVLFGILLLCAWAEGLKQTVHEPATAEVFGLISTLSACGVMLLPVQNVIRSVQESMESVSVFMYSFVPVYAGVLLTGGQTATAASYQTVVLFAAELIAQLAANIIVPLMVVSLAFGVAGTAAPQIKLGKAGMAINKTASWLIGITTSLFVGLLSLQGMVGAAADTLGMRAMRFSLASFVPVVGGSLSEAFATVKSCLHLLKSTLGGFGVIATVLIVIPPLIECLVWNLCLSLCGVAADMFDLTTVSSLLQTVRSVMKTLIAVLAACMLFMIISVTIVTTAGRGV